MDRVGAVYVEVLTDTSNVKPQIERALKQIGQKDGQEAADRYWDAFQKRTEKAQKQIKFDQLSRSIDKSLDSVIKAQSARIKKVVREGGKVELKISKKAYADLEKLADEFDVPLSKVLDQFTTKLPAAYKKAISDAEKVLAKEESDRAKAVADFAKLRAKAEREYELDRIRFIEKAWAENVRFDEKRQALIAQAWRENAKRDKKQIADRSALEERAWRENVARDKKAAELRARAEREMDVAIITKRKKDAEKALQSLAKIYVKEFRSAEAQRLGTGLIDDKAIAQVDELAAKLGLASESLRKSFDELANAEYVKQAEKYEALILKAQAENAKFDKDQQARRLKAIRDELDAKLKALAKEAEAEERMWNSALAQNAAFDKKRAKEAARQLRLETEAAAREWDLFKNWLGGRDYKGGLDKLAVDIERATTTGVRKGFVNGKDVDFGPKIQLRIEQVIKDSADRYGKSADDVIRGLRSRVAKGIAKEAKDESRALDSVEGRILNFTKRVGRGGNLLTQLFIGPFALAAGAAGVVLKAVTAIGPAIASAGEALVSFGAKAAVIFPKVGALLARIGVSLGSIAAPIAAIALPIAIPLAWIAFGAVLSGIVSLLNAVAAGALVVGTALVGAVSSLVLLAGVAAGAAAGYGLFAFGAKDALGAVSALNKALSTGAKEDFAAYNEALKKLGPNAKAAVQATRPLLESFKGIRAELSEKIFLDTAPLISNLKPLGDAAKSIASQFGDSINTVFQDLLGKLGSGELVGKIQGIGAILSQVFLNTGLAVNNFFVGFVNALSAISPIIGALSGAIKGISDRFLEWTSQAENMEALRGWFQKVYDVASAVWGIIKSLIGVVASLFNQSGESTVGWLEAIKAKLDEWKNWIDNNQDKIVKWIDAAWVTLSNLYNTARDVFNAFQQLDTPAARKGLDTIVTSIGFVLEAIAKLSSAWVILKNLLFGGINAKITFSVFGVSWILDKLGISGSSSGGGGGGGGGSPSRPAPSRPGVGPKPMAAGGFVKTPQLSLIGEAGPEVVIPLTRPIGMVDPEIRELTKMVRGTVGGSGSSGYSQQKVWNVTQNITPVNADPNLVAASVLNRFAIAARG